MSQRVNSTTSNDDSSRPPSSQSSGMDTPMTGAAHQHSVLKEKCSATKQQSAAGGDGDNSSPAPGKVADKNPFGLKPEYKTALRDFFVRSSQIHIIRPWLTPHTENFHLLDMGRSSACHRRCGCLHRRWRDTAGNEHHLR